MVKKSLSLDAIIILLDSSPKQTILTRMSVLVFLLLATGLRGYHKG